MPCQIKCKKKPSPCRKDKTERGYVGMESVWGGIPVYPQVFGVNSSSVRPTSNYD